VICSICQKRKAKRYCPAKAHKICAVCCGTEREVTIDCPSDCVYLMASRQHYDQRREVDWEHIPFADRAISRRVANGHEDLLLRLSYTVCSFTQDNPALVDADVQVSLQALAESYETLASGIVYEKPPGHSLQRGLYERLKIASTEYKNSGAGQVVIARATPVDSDIRDALILLTQLAAVRSNGRPKSRAFIDSLRSQFKPGTFGRPEPSLILAP
jgi:hypothetical protein